MGNVLDGEAEAAPPPGEEQPPSPRPPAEKKPRPASDAGEWGSSPSDSPREVNPPPAAPPRPERPQQPGFVATPLLANARLVAGQTLQPAPSAQRGLPLNSWFPAFRYQSLYTAAEVHDAGVRPGNRVTGLGLFLAELPNEDEASLLLRIGFRWTRRASLNSGFLRVAPTAEVETAVRDLREERGVHPSFAYVDDPATARANTLARQIARDLGQPDRRIHIYFRGTRLRDGMSIPKEALAPAEARPERLSADQLAVDHKRRARTVQPSPRKRSKRGAKGAQIQAPAAEARPAAPTAKAPRPSLPGVSEARPSLEGRGAAARRWKAALSHATARAVAATPPARGPESTRKVGWKVGPEDSVSVGAEPSNAAPPRHGTMRRITGAVSRMIGAKARARRRAEQAQATESDNKGEAGFAQFLDPTQKRKSRISEARALEATGLEREAGEGKDEPDGRSVTIDMWLARESQGGSPAGGDSSAHAAVTFEGTPDAKKKARKAKKDKKAKKRAKKAKKKARKERGGAEASTRDSPVEGSPSGSDAGTETSSPAGPGPGPPRDPAHSIEGEATKRVFLRPYSSQAMKRAHGDYDAQMRLRNVREQAVRDVRVSDVLSAAAADTTKALEEQQRLVRTARAGGGTRRTNSPVKAPHTSRPTGPAHHKAPSTDTSLPGASMLSSLEGLVSARSGAAAPQPRQPVPVLAQTVHRYRSLPPLEYELVDVSEDAAGIEGEARGAELVEQMDRSGYWPLFSSPSAPWDGERALVVSVEGLWSEQALGGGVMLQRVANPAQGVARAYVEAGASQDENDWMYRLAGGPRESHVLAARLYVDSPPPACPLRPRLRHIDHKGGSTNPRIVCKELRATWQAPVAPSAAEITAWHLTYWGSTREMWLQAQVERKRVVVVTDPYARSFTLKNLVAGASYRFTVAAESAVGLGPASKASPWFATHKPVVPAGMKGWSLAQAVTNRRAKVLDKLTINGVPNEGRFENGVPAIYAAALAGSFEIVAILIRAGADVDARHALSGATALHAAASTGEEEILLTLLDSGAVPNAMDNQGLTPLDLATKHRMGRVASILVRAGGLRPVVPTPLGPCFEPWNALMGPHALVQVRSLRAEIRGSHEPIYFNGLLEASGAGLPPITTTTGALRQVLQDAHATLQRRIKLFRAVGEGRAEDFRLVVRRHAPSMGAMAWPPGQTRTKESLLHFAAQWPVVEQLGRRHRLGARFLEEVLRRMEESGMDLDEELMHRRPTGHTVLMAAVSGGDHDVVLRLLQLSRLRVANQSVHWHLSALRALQTMDAFPAAEKQQALRVLNTVLVHFTEITEEEERQEERDRLQGIERDHNDRFTYLVHVQWINEILCSIARRVPRQDTVLAIADRAAGRDMDTGEGFKRQRALWTEEDMKEEVYRIFSRLHEDDILELREGVCGGTVRIRVEPLLAALDQGRSMRAATESFLATVSAPTGLDFADLCYLLFFARAADADGNGGVDDFEFAVFLEWEMRRLGEGGNTLGLRERINALSGPRSLLHHAAETAMPESLQVLLDDAMCYLEERDEDGCTPLAAAARGRTWEAPPACLQCRKRPMNAYQRPCGHTSLCMQCVEKEVEEHAIMRCRAPNCAHQVTLGDLVNARSACVRMLLDSGADPLAEDAGGRTALALALYHQATEPYLVRQLLESGLGQRLALPRRMQLEDRYHGARPGFSVMHLAASKAQVTAGLMILLWCGPERCSRLRDEAGRSWMEVCPNAIVQSLLVEFAAVLEEWEAGPERHLLEELRAAGRGRLALGEKKRARQLESTELYRRLVDPSRRQRREEEDGEDVDEDEDEDESVTGAHIEEERTEALQKLAQSLGQPASYAPSLDAFLQASVGVPPRASFEHTLCVTLRVDVVRCKGLAAADGVFGEGGPLGTASDPYVRLHAHNLLPMPYSAYLRHDRGRLAGTDLAVPAFLLPWTAAEVSSGPDNAPSGSVVLAGATSRAGTGNAGPSGSGRAGGTAGASIVLQGGRLRSQVGSIRKAAARGAEMSTAGDVSGSRTVAYGPATRRVREDDNTEFGYNPTQQRRGKGVVETQFGCADPAAFQHAQRQSTFISGPGAPRALVGGVLPVSRESRAATAHSTNRLRRAVGDGGEESDEEEDGNEVEDEDDEGEEGPVYVDQDEAKAGSDEGGGGGVNAVPEELKHKLTQATPDPAKGRGGTIKDAPALAQAADLLKAAAQKHAAFWGAGAGAGRPVLDSGAMLGELHGAGRLTAHQLHTCREYLGADHPRIRDAFLAFEQNQDVEGLVSALVRLEASCRPGYEANAISDIVFAAEDEEPPRGFVKVTTTEEGTSAVLGNKKKYALCFRRGVVQGGLKPITRVVVCPTEAAGEAMGVDDGFQVIRSTYMKGPLPPDFPCVCFERGQDVAPLTMLRLTSSTSETPGMERHKCPLSTTPNLWMATNTVGLDLPYSCATPGLEHETFQDVYSLERFQRRPAVVEHRSEVVMDQNNPWWPANKQMICKLPFQEPMWLDVEVWDWNLSQADKRLGATEDISMYTVMRWLMKDAEEGGSASTVVMVGGLPLGQVCKTLDLEGTDWKGRHAKGKVELRFTLAIECSTDANVGT